MPTPTPVLSDGPIPLHYGNPAAEGRSLDAGTALVRVPLEVVVVEGDDRRRWLNLFTSQLLTDIEPGTSTEALVLAPEGHIQHAIALLDDGERSFLIVDAGTRERLETFLRSMVFATPVTISRSDSTVFAVLNATENLTPVLDGLPTWIDPWPHTTGTSYGPADVVHPAREWDLRLVLADDADALVERWIQAGGTLAGLWALESARINAWRPRCASEVDERSIPHELDWLRTAVHLDKGCYRGQETIARVVNLGRPPRRLTFLHLDGSVEHLPSRGDDVLAGERVVGQITSAAWHWEDGPIALAIIRRSVAEDAELVVRSTVEDTEILIAAAQTPIVPQAGASAATPAVRPGAGLRVNPARKPKG